MDGYDHDLPDRTSNDELGSNSDTAGCGSEHEVRAGSGGRRGPGRYREVLLGALHNKMRKVLTKYLRDKGWLPTTALNKGINAADADTRWALEEMLSTTVRVKPRARGKFGRELLRNEVVEQMVRAGRCEMREGPDGQEVRLMPAVAPALPEASEDGAPSTGCDPVESRVDAGVAADETPAAAGEVPACDAGQPAEDCEVGVALPRDDE